MGSDLPTCVSGRARRAPPLTGVNGTLGSRGGCNSLDDLGMLRWRLAAPVAAGVREVCGGPGRMGGRFDAAGAAGVSEASAWRWIQERGGVRPRRPVPFSARFLSLAEREEIAAGAAAGLAVRQIARRLGRAASTVSRELARNRRGAGTGRWRRTGARRARRARPRPAKLAADGELRDCVRAGLGKSWSPEQISATLRKQFPGRPEMRVCHETIYQSMYVQGRGALRRDLAACLRTGRAVRRPHAAGPSGAAGSRA